MGKSIKEAWQTFRAKTTNQVAVRDCQTQTPIPADEEMALQASDNARNHQRDSETSPAEDEALVNNTDTTPLLTTSASPAPGGGPGGDPGGKPHGNPGGDPDTPKNEKAQIAKKVAIYAAGFGAAAAVIGVGAFIAAPVALAAAGFTTVGIAAGSTGASMMSAAAIANGGGVAAGSVVAVLQSAGAAGGIGASICAGLGIGTAAVGTALVAAVEVTVSQVRYIKRQNNGNSTVDVGTQTDNDNSTDTDTKTDSDSKTDTNTKADGDSNTDTNEKADGDSNTDTDTKKGTD